MVTVRPAERADARPAAAALARAFADDPLMRYLIPEARYHHRLTEFFKFECLTTLAGVQVADDDGVVGGAAVWTPPGSHATGLSVVVRHLPHLVRALGRALPRGARVFRAIDDAHPDTPPHWYLQTLGAAVPGRGIGGLLLRAGLAKADADGLPVYLESSSATNIPLYERYGFRVTGEIPLPGGPPLHPMWRESATVEN